MIENIVFLCAPQTLLALSKRNGLVISFHKQDCYHYVQHKSIVYNAPRIIQLTWEPLMIPKIKKNNDLDFSISQVSLGVVFLPDRVVVTLNTPSLIINVFLFII